MILAFILLTYLYLLLYYTESIYIHIRRSIRFSERHEAFGYLITFDYSITLITFGYLITVIAFDYLITLITFGY